ncbi:Probable polyamine transporter At3g13620 [Linum grandiflorum]
MVDEEQAVGSSLAPPGTAVSPPQSPPLDDSLKPRKLITLVPLIFLIYFEVAGGPYGEEPAVQAAGPLFALLGFLIFPFIWSVPEALITAELSTAFPGNGGFVIWAQRAFGPFCGSLMGSWKFLSGVINVAAFPVLCIDYLEKLFPALESGWPRTVAIIVAIVVLSFINYLGLNIVGYAAVGLGIISLSPFVLMTLIAIPKIRPSSTLAGEVDKPGKTFPVALPVAVILTCLSYLIPLMAVIGAVDVDQTQWGSGFHATAAELIAGNWLKIWLEIGAALSAIGLFEAQLSSCSFQILGMAELGILPKFFAVRSKWFHTPWLGILVPAVMTLGVSFLQFTDIISSANFIYSLSMLLEFASFLWLRRKMPNLERPYRIPMRLPWLCFLSLIPCAFLVLLLVTATKIVYVISLAMTGGSILWFLLMSFCRKKNCCIFSIDLGHQPCS